MEMLPGARNPRNHMAQNVSPTIMGVEHGFETVFAALCSVIGSAESVQDRLAAVVSAVGHLEYDSFPDDETWHRFQSFLSENTMVVKREDGSAASRTSQMSDGEAARWLQTVFVLFSDIAAAYGREYFQAA